MDTDTVELRARVSPEYFAKAKKGRMAHGYDTWPDFLTAAIDSFLEELDRRKSEGRESAQKDTIFPGYGALSSEEQTLISQVLEVLRSTHEFARYNLISCIGVSLRYKRDNSMPSPTPETRGRKGPKLV